MKSTLAIVVLLGTFWICTAQNLSSTNIDAILKNDRLLTNYIKCLLNQGKCSRDGREFKARLPDIIQNDCSKCTETQKANSMKVINFVKTRRPQEWKELAKIYDPLGLHEQRLRTRKF